MGLGLLPVVMQAGAGWSAEQITFTYGAIERSISVSSLAAYARDGEIPSDLRAFTSYLNEQQLQDLQAILNTHAALSPVTVAQFLYTDQGEILLRRLGEVIRTESNLSGFYAIRSALILAAADPEGLTVLKVLETFPLRGMRVDLNQTLRIMGDLETLIQQTQAAIALVVEQSIAEAGMATGLDLSSLRDLRQPGIFTWEKQTITLTDAQRDRTFPADIYLPKTFNQEPLYRAPLIVISHGLGSDRSTYAYLAKHLASYGFAVAVPEHPGSNSQQLQALISGRASQVTAPSEFVDRPLDIKYLLDQLGHLMRTEPSFRRRIDLQQVGVIGQSMGGYTALALAGAQINFQQLEADCTEDTFNLSLLLQCRALDLPPQTPNFYDQRVKAVIAISPIGSSLLGEADYAAIRTPVMIISASSDTIAPALPEQIRPFTWLQTPEKYLLLLRGGTHFSTIDVPDSEAAGAIVQLPSQLVGPEPSIARRYLRSMGLAFFKVYVAQEPDYQSHLAPAYINSMSEAAMPMHLVRSLTLMQLVQILGEDVVPSSSAETSEVP
ncbi:MAG: alpha/beta hydrolase [Elainellaceae cyanobacterium]